MHSRLQGLAHRSGPRHQLCSRRVSPTSCRAASAARASRSGSKARTPEQLNEPLQVGSSCRGRQDVKIYPGPLSLQQYMTLPVEQYFILDPSSVSWLGENRFLLSVPRISILNVWLEPQVEISVNPYPTGVTLTANNCIMRGSQLIESLRLDERFCMRFVTELSWSQSPLANQGNSISMASVGEEELTPSGSGVIVGEAKLDVWCEIIPPFNLMPKEVLQATTNAVLSGVVRMMLPLFLRRLGDDYVKWSTQPEYRVTRAQVGEPTQKHSNLKAS